MNVSTLSCANLFHVMDFAQLTRRESLRGIEVCHSATHYWFAIRINAGASGAHRAHAGAHGARVHADANGCAAA
jgi:hypothetical protein